MRRRGLEVAQRSTGERNVGSTLGGSIDGGRLLAHHLFGPRLSIQPLLIGPVLFCSGRHARQLAGLMPSHYPQTRPRAVSGSFGRKGGQLFEIEVALELVQDPIVDLTGAVQPQELGPPCRVGLQH